MAGKAAATVGEYLAGLPPDRRSILSKVRDVIRRRLPKGYEEGMGFGMISYTIPLERYPDTYNGQPLCYAALASQKNHCAVYLTGAYADPDVEKAIRDGFRRAGRTLDMGKSCIRFRTADDLPLDVIGDAVASVTPDAFIARYESARRAVNPRPRSRAGDGRTRPSARRTPPPRGRTSGGRRRPRARTRSPAARAGPRSGR